MRREKIINQCSAPGEEITWERKGKREAVVYRKSLIYFDEKGLVADIRAAGGKLKSTDKLDRYFLLAERMEKGEDKVEGFVSKRKTTENGIDALMIETVAGEKKWIDKTLTDNFMLARKYWFDESGWNKNMVIIEEEGKVTGMIMTLNISDN